MIKTVGLAGIVLSAVYIAWLNVRRCSERIRLLSDLKITFSVLKTEIGRRLMPLPEALERLSREPNPAVREFYGSCAKEIRVSEKKLFSDIWCANAKRVFGGKLTSDELETLERLGFCLGKLEAAEQEREIAKCEKDFEEYLQTERTQGFERGKMRAAVCVCAGIAVLVLFV